MVELVPPAADRLREVRAPTLVIAAELDQPVTIQRADLLAQVIPGARRITIPGVAHLPNMERPEEFNGVVLGFLAEQR